MARPRAPQPVKLLIGLLSGDPDLLRRARQLLSHRFGPVELESDQWPFDQSDYYEPEMGPNLQRWFLAFQDLVDPGALTAIKLETNARERQIADDTLSPDATRPVNIDPGYIDLTKLVLASTKDRGHRLYLGQGIYGEVTLLYTRQAWQPLPWTYPDYLQPHYHAFFARVRERLLEQRRAEVDEAAGEAAP